jgi:DNA-binding response OmpR family regulator
METDRRAQIQRSLRSLAKSHAATMALLEEMLALVCEEFSLDPSSYFEKTSLSTKTKGDKLGLSIDRGFWSVTFRGKACFLGNTLPFKFLSRLAERPNRYFSYDELLSDVWQGIRSESAVRSVVKTLRNKLRQSGMSDLAAAIDGSVFGHYALKLVNL